jgi:hypothetical protein
MCGASARGATAKATIPLRTMAAKRNEPFMSMLPHARPT